MTERPHEPRPADQSLAYWSCVGGLVLQHADAGRLQSFLDANLKSGRVISVWTTEAQSVSEK